MIEDTLRAKLAEYNPANAVEQENVLAEILQHFILYHVDKLATRLKAGK